MSRPIRALYVHVPFCHTICGYCDFYSEVLDKAAVVPLVDALLAELRQHSQTYELAPQTIFVGGGTPTTLPASELRRLLVALRALVPADATLEFTVEANPATVTPEIATALVECGVTRVSIGAQSFDTGELRVLERIHAPAQVPQTVETCRRAGIRQVNLDLIFAVPGQSLASWRANLDAALELGPQHLSCYGLTYERGTPLQRQLTTGQVRAADPDLEARMFETTIELLAARGYEQYEISNFARPGCECRHNLTYWHNEAAIGVGPSAAGFDGELRYKNVPDTAAYVRTLAAGGSPRIEQERLSEDRRARETAMLELRLRAGIDRRRFGARFAQDPVALFADAIARHRDFGLLEVDESGIRLTRAGLLVADSVIADFL